MLGRAWLGTALLRRAVQRAARPLGPIDPMVERLAPGKSFLDVGALWGVHGRISFLAETAGATRVTAIDLSEATPEFLEAKDRRGSNVRFVRADLHDADAGERVGPHDVVWCSGVLYHCPDPVRSIACLKRLTLERLVILTASLPEVPGAPNGAVFFPHLSAPDRRRIDRAYDIAGVGRGSARLGLTTPFDPAEGYGNWWWGLTPSAITGMLTAGGFDVEDVATSGFHTRVTARVAAGR
jgi:SAM-dependent methyltransferase